MKTDRAGRFVFPRVPPVKSSVRAQLSVLRDSRSAPAGRSRSISSRDERVELDLGGQGIKVKGRVLLSGDAATKIDLHKSLN